MTAKITPTVIPVTPSMARRWLGSNLNNRPLRDRRIAKYADDMLNGRWTFAGDPIRFDSDGNLIDGQHRLYALILAEMPSVTFLVIRGLPPEAQTVMDQGAKRTPGDQLAMRGYKNAQATAASVKQFLLWERGLLFRDAKRAIEISSPQIEQWCGEHPESVANLVASHGRIRQAGGRPSVAGAAFLIFESVDPEAAATFFHLLATGAGTEGHPITTLDRKLRRQERMGLKVPARDELASFIQAWNAWREQRTINKFLRPRGGSWTPESFPVAV